MSGDQLISTQSIPNQPSAHPRVANAREPILHASWEIGCTTSTMVCMIIVADVFAIIMMESLPLLMWRHLCHPCNNGAVTIINAEASLLLSSWHRHPHCNGVVIADAQVSLQSRYLCHHCNNVVALIARVLLQLSNWCCHPCHDGVITIIFAQASLLLSRWRCCPCYTGAIANIAQALYPLLHWHHCHYLDDLFDLALHGHHHHCCTGIVTPVKLACLHHGVSHISKRFN